MNTFYSVENLGGHEKAVHEQHGHEGLDLLNKFYPDSWMYDALYESAEELRPAQRPFYRVVCETEEEIGWAYRTRPPYVDADIVMKETVLVQA